MRRLNSQAIKRVAAIVEQLLARIYNAARSLEAVRQLEEFDPSALVPVPCSQASGSAADPDSVDLDAAPAGG